MNLVMILGRLTKDVEIRKTNSGESVGSFTLAVNRNYTSADGVQADFINCNIWGKQADNMAKYCAKGSQVAVRGSIRVRNYEGQDGKKVYVTEVVCAEVEFLSHKEKDTTKAKIDELFEVTHSNESADVFDIEF